MKITKFIFIALLITACAEDPGDLTETTHSNIDKINAEGEICENGKEKEIVCGEGDQGVQKLKCEAGIWIDVGTCKYCDDSIEDSLEKIISCGINGRGVQTQVCVSGEWINKNECVDPDECVDEDERTGTTMCGELDIMLFEQKCIKGKWEDTEVCQCASEEYPYFHKGLCWSDKSSNTMNWNDAIDYCEDLGGRLPNIQELRMLIKECPRVEYPQPDDQTELCEIEDPDKLTYDARTQLCDGCSPDSSGKYSVFADTGWFWSSSELSDSLVSSWSLGFSNGSVDSFNENHGNNVRCVR